MNIEKLEQLASDTRRAYKIAERKNQFNRADTLRIEYRALLRDLYAAKGLEYPLSK